MHDVAVIGAGVAGLSLAGALRDLGFGPVVLERASGVGGRCATRRVDGRPVDHGAPFLHGRDPEFVAALEAVTNATPIPGWPRVREGAGMPCQPKAFTGGDFVVAFREGVSCFPKRLAQGVDVRLQSEVKGLALIEAPGREGHKIFELEMASGETLHAASIALTMPVPEAIRLLKTLEPPSELLAPIVPLLGEVRTIPCASVIAVYPAEAKRPRWDILYPADAEEVHAIVHDSSKREEPEPLTLVVHGRSRFSRAAIGRPIEEWSRELLSAAAMIAGDWVAHPSAIQAHVWQHAMVQAITELAAPIALRIGQGSILGLCGDGFGPEGGIEGAYRSGILLATRIAELVGAPSHV